MKAQPARSSLWIEITLALTLCLSAAAGGWFYHLEAETVRRNLEKELAAITEIKAEQIGAWYTDQISDADMTMHPFLLGDLRRLLHHPEAPALPILRDRLRVIARQHDYADILLVDLQGEARLGISTPPPRHTGYRSALENALRTGKPQFVEPHRETESPISHISVVSPIYSDAPDHSSPLGALVFVTDAQRYLFPLIQTRIDTDRSAEALLVRRDGFHLHYLNHLPGMPSARAMERVALNGADDLSRIAGQGKTGFYQGTDYRGIETAACIRPVPQTPWTLIYKIDRKKAFAEWHRRSRLLLALILGWSVLIISAALIFRQHAKKRHYQTLYHSEAALRNAAERGSTALNAIGDGVIATDAAGRVELLNPMAETMTGWRKEEATGKSIEETVALVHPTTGERIKNTIPGVLRTGTMAGAAENRVLISRNGTRFQVTDSATPIRSADGTITGAVQVLRDMTDLQTARDAVTAGEIRYRLLVETANEGIWSMDADHVTTFVNRSMAEMLGYTSSEMLGRHVEDFFFPKDFSFHKARMAARHSGRDEVYERRFRRRDGSELWTLVSAKAIMDAEGRFTGSFAMFTDITQHKEAEAALQRQVRFEHGIAAASAALLTTRDPEQKITAALTHLREVTAVSRVYLFENFHDDAEGLCMRQVHEVCAPEVPPEIDNPALQHYAYADGFSRWRDRLSAGAAVRGHIADFPPDEQEILHSQGIISILAMPLMAGGEWRGFVGFDETRERREWLDAEISLLGTVADLIGGYMALRETQAALRASEEKFSRAFYTSPYAITITRAADGQLIEVNEAFTAISGYTREEALADTSIGLNLWVDAADREKAVDQLAQGRSIHGWEVLFRNKFGKRLDCLFSAQMIRLRDEACILSSISDISERKQAEAERERLRSQLGQAQKMESVGRLAGGVAHDFNNMLSVILGHAEQTLADLPPESPHRESLEEIQKAALRSADLTRQLLAFARKQTVTPKVLDLNATIAAMLKMLRRIIGENIDLDWRPAPALGPVFIDPAQIDQILANLCVNARDAIAPNVGRVTIETRRIAPDHPARAALTGLQPGAHAQLTVSDDGCGMDGETLANVFEPFFTTKGVGKGTGLGLATVYGIVKQNNGAIRADSTVGEGSRFEIYLPLHAGNTAHAAARPVSRHLEPGDETILLVEDERSILMLIQKVLERLGYTVLAAATPGEAIHLAREHAGEIDLLITDVIMPEMNGRELAAGLLALYPGLQRLFMSGYTDDVIAHHGVLAEGVHFIQKPFSNRKLAAKVRAVLHPERDGENPAE